MSATYRLPFEPVPKERPRRAKNGHYYTPRRSQDAEGQLARELMRQRPGDLLAGQVAVRVELHCRRRGGDLDNYVKLLLDAARGVLWTDDRQVVELHAAVTSGAAVGCSFLEVWDPDTEPSPCRPCAREAVDA